jgi:hypothetical protein
MGLSCRPSHAQIATLQELIEALRKLKEEVKNQVRLFFSSSSPFPN